MSGKPYCEAEPSAFALAQSDNPERVRAWHARAMTPEQLMAECERLAKLLGPQARVSIGTTCDLSAPYCSGLTAQLYPDGHTMRGPMHVTSTDFPSLITKAERHIAQWHAHRRDRAREALARARAEAEALGVAEVV